MNPDPSLHDLHVRSLRQFAWMLVVASPALCGVSLLTGEATLQGTLRYSAVVQTGFVLIRLAARRPIGARYPSSCSSP